jgi:methionyl-tRNA formyltransferase
MGKAIALPRVFHMKFIYFGSSGFSYTVLEELYKKSFIPSLVVSKPDKPKGRGLKIVATRVSEFAKDKKIPLLKPQYLKEKPITQKLIEENADFLIVADYGKIIPLSLLEIPNVFSLCVHPSLLPLYRGPAPIEYALLEGQKETGISIFKINERVDAGDIILQEKIAIDEHDDFFSLSQKLAVKGSSLLIKVINNIEHKDYKLTPQNESEVILTQKLKKEDGRIIWNSSAGQIRNLIRATLGWPSAYTYYGDLMIKILSAEAIEQESADTSGTIVKFDKKGIYIATGEGILRIKKLKPQGKKEMDAWAFICGHRVKAGDLLK